MAARTWLHYIFVLSVSLEVVGAQANNGVGNLIVTSSQILASTVVGQCRDIFPDPTKCAQWKNNGFCQKNAAQMHRLCRFTCGACQSQIGDCVNSAIDMVCDRLAARKQCGHADANKCQDSCGTCSAKKDYLVSVYLTTWNAANQAPGNSDLVKFAGVSGQQRPDIVVIGMEEMGNQKEWLIRIQTIMTQRGYVQVKVQVMGQITEIIYIKAILARAVTLVGSTYKGTGVGNIYTDKGGVIIRFNLGETSLAFVTSHLESGQENMKARFQDYNQIVRQKIPNWKSDLASHDYVFWQGDLNFRIAHQKSVVEKLIKMNGAAQLLKFDQLLQAHQKGLIFQGFEEAPITFVPTYKFDLGTDIYDTSAKQRVPSWTDRILWRENKSKTKARVLPFSYVSMPEYKISDHKPVALLSFITI